MKGNGPKVYIKKKIIKKRFLKCIKGRKPTGRPNARAKEPFKQLNAAAVSYGC